MIKRIIGFFAWVKWVFKDKENDLDNLEGWVKAVEKNTCGFGHLCEKLDKAILDCDIKIDSEKLQDGESHYFYSIPRLSKAYQYRNESTLITTNEFLPIKFCPFCGQRPERRHDEKYNRI